MKKFLINVNGNSYEVEVEEINTGEVASRPVASVLTSRPAAPVSTPVSTLAEPAPEVKKEITVSAGQEVMEAPMPGNIWKILVSEGDTVKSGDVLLILEAMKMENEIVAPRDGKVISIATSEGSTVNTGDKLVIIE